MAFSLPYKNLHINTPGALVVNVGSTAEHNVVGTATATSTSRSVTYRWEFGDYTTTQAIPTFSTVRTGGIGDFGIEHQQYRALLHLKGPLAGTATSTSAYGLVAALVAATSTAQLVSDLAPVDAYVIDTKFIVQTSATSTGMTQSVYLFGQVPTALGARFAAVQFYRVGAAGQTAAASTAVDCIIEGI